MKENTEKTEKDNPKMVLTFLAQQYGMTVEMLMEQFGCKKEDIIVEPNPDA